STWRLARMAAASMRIALFGKEFGPVGFGRTDMTGDVFHPLFLNVEAVIEIKFTIHDLPRVRIDARGITLGHRPCAIPAELRRMAFRIGLEGGQVFRRGKTPHRAVPLVAERLVALRR